MSGSGDKNPFKKFPPPGKGDMGHALRRRPGRTNLLQPNEETPQPQAPQQTHSDMGLLSTPEYFYQHPRPLSAPSSTTLSLGSQTSLRSRSCDDLVFNPSLEDMDIEMSSTTSDDGPHPTTLQPQESTDEEAPKPTQSDMSMGDTPYFFRHSRPSSAPSSTSIAVSETSIRSLSFDDLFDPSLAMDIDEPCPVPRPTTAAGAPGNIGAGLRGKYIPDVTIPVPPPRRRSNRPHTADPTAPTHTISESGTSRDWVPPPPPVPRPTHPYGGISPRSAAPYRPPFLDFMSPRVPAQCISRRPDLDQPVATGSIPKETKAPKDPKPKEPKEKDQKGKKPGRGKK